MHRIRVGVIRGGHKDEHEISLNTGSTVMNNLPSEKYNVREIFIDRNLNWFSNGIKVNPYEVLMHVDVVFNALHGKYGEDGKVQHILETHNVPFTGSGSFSSSLGMNKFLSKQVYLKNNIKTPQYRILESTDDIDQKLYDVFRAFPLPLIVKPTSNGSSVGISLVNDFKSLKNSIINAFKHSDSVIIEEYINGREATCGVIDSFRNMPFYALPAIEIINDKGNFFNYNAKYAGQTEEIVPGNFTNEEKKQIEKMAIEAHNSLGLRHYSRSDFIIHPTRGIFILETNTLPGLTDESLFPKALKSVGSSIGNFLDHIIQLAISKK